MTGKFRGLVLPGRESYRVLDRAGTVLLDRPDDGTGERPEVSRGELRQMLLDALPDGIVQWGRKVSGVQTPQYIGFTSVEYFLFDSDTRHRATAEAVGAGSLFALAAGKGFLVHRERGGTLHTYGNVSK